MPVIRVLIIALVMLMGWLIAMIPMPFQSELLRSWVRGVCI